MNQPPPQEPENVEEIVAGKEPLKDSGESSSMVQNRNIQAVCFNCGEIGHLSSACGRPKVCFICHQSDHVVDLCPAWSKPPAAAQYYGSANRGLGFYHIDVGDRGNRFKH